MLNSCILYSSTLNSLHLLKVILHWLSLCILKSKIFSYKGRFLLIPGSILDMFYFISNVYGILLTVTPLYKTVSLQPCCNVKHIIIAGKVVCYHGSWSVYRPGDGKFEIEYIDPHLCTHVIYAFVGIGYDGSIRILDTWNEIDKGK